MTEEEAQMVAQIKQLQGLRNAVQQQQAQVSKFCTYCGSELVQFTERMGFDPYTGAEVNDKFLQCPKYSSWFRPHHSRRIWMGRL